MLVKVSICYAYLNIYNLTFSLNRIYSCESDQRYSNQDKNTSLLMLQLSIIIEGDLLKICCMRRKSWYFSYLEAFEINWYRFNAV